MYSRLCISLFLPYFIRINLSYTFSSHRVFWYRLLRGVFDDSAILLTTWKFFVLTSHIFQDKKYSTFKKYKINRIFLLCFSIKNVLNLQNHYHSTIVPEPSKIISLPQGTHLHLGPFFRKWVSFSVLFASWLGCFFLYVARWELSYGSIR